MGVRFRKTRQGLKHPVLTKALGDAEPPKDDAASTDFPPEVIEEHNRRYPPTKNPRQPTRASRELTPLPEKPKLVPSTLPERDPPPPPYNGPPPPPENVPDWAGAADQPPPANSETYQLPTNYHDMNSDMLRGELREVNQTINDMEVGAGRPPAADHSQWEREMKRLRGIRKILRTEQEHRRRETDDDRAVNTYDLGHQSVYNRLTFVRPLSTNAPRTIPNEYKTRPVMELVKAAKKTKDFQEYDEIMQVLADALKDEGLNDDYLFWLLATADPLALQEILGR